jgi:hypothetical protein
MSAEVTLRQLRYFVLGEELNCRRAAEKLFISQPALSTAIKQLEHQFGVALLRRSTREVALTDLGAAWLPQMQTALDGVDAVVANLVTLLGTRRGVLRLGYLIGTGEQRQGVFRSQERTGQVDREAAIPLLQRGVLDRLLDLDTRALTRTSSCPASCQTMSSAAVTSSSSEVTSIRRNRRRPLQGRQG